MLPFRFVERMPSYDAAEAFCVRVDPKIETTKDLMKSLYFLLWFPKYLRCNWDVLAAGLRDLAWVPCPKIVLVHQRLPNICQEDLQTYLQVLRDCALGWQGDHRHDLEVVFRINDCAPIEALLTPPQAPDAQGA